MSRLSVTLMERHDRHGRTLWRLNKDFYYEFGPDCRIVVPAGYITNFGTVPRIFARLITPASLREAAVIHDWMCNESEHQELNSGYSRWIADAVFRQAMIDFKVAGPVRRALVFLAVRLASTLPR